MSLNNKSQTSIAKQSGSVKEVMRHPKTYLLHLICLVALFCVFPNGNIQGEVDFAVLDIESIPAGPDSFDVVPIIEVSIGAEENPVPMQMEVRFNDAVVLAATVTWFIIIDCPSADSCTTEDCLVGIQTDSGGVIREDVNCTAACLCKYTNDSDKETQQAFNLPAVRLELQPGDVLRVELDALNIVDELDENNNVFEKVVGGGPVIPTLTEWGMIIFSILLFGWMAWAIQRRRVGAVIRN